MRDAKGEKVLAYIQHTAPPASFAELNGGVVGIMNNRNISV